MGITGRVGADIRTIHLLLSAAEEAARAMGDDEPGAEHMVLAALGLPDGTARAAFAAVGADPDAFRAAVLRQHRDALAAVGVDPAMDARVRSEPAPPRGPMQGTPAGRRTFQDAVALSRRRRPSRLRGADVVAAAAAHEHGTVPRALRVMGVDRDALRRAAERAAAAA